MEGPYQRPGLGLRKVRAPRHRGRGGGGKRTPREREHTHAQRGCGEYQKGDRTKLTERTDRVQWRTSGRGYGTPGQDGPPHTARDMRGGKGETGETRHQVPARAPQTGRERRARTTRALQPPRQ